MEAPTPFHIENCMETPHAQSENEFQIPTNRNVYNIYLDKIPYKLIIY